jgi:hypothetical protein
MTTGFSKIQFVYPYLLERVKGAVQAVTNAAFFKVEFSCDIFNVLFSGCGFLRSAGKGRSAFFRFGTPPP